MTLNVLILCTHNSARSVLAEGMLNHWAQRLGKDVKAFSAGSAPSGRINPFAIEVLQAAGVNTDGFRSKSWDEFATPVMQVVITVCDNAAQEACPYWPGTRVKVHWGYPDPSDTEGGDAARRQAFELTRQAISYRMLQLLALDNPETMSDAQLQERLKRICAN